MKPALCHTNDVILEDGHLALIEMAAQHPRVAVCLLGETGTGKEELARLIHRTRMRKEGKLPFVSVNCATLNGELAMSMLFGHRRGAFSGADRNTIGYVGEADGGILFLDEIHTLSFATQQRLLRVLNDGSYTRLGDTLEMKASFQVIVASTMDLDAAVDAGGFLLDLRTRLLGIDIFLKPLRERLEDLPALIELFLLRAGVSVTVAEFDRLVNRCRSFYWRGNIRQLFKVLQSLVIYSNCLELPILAENLPTTATMFPPEQAKERSEVEDPDPGQSTFQLLTKALHFDVPLSQVLQEIEKAIIACALKRHRRISDVYAALGIGRNTLDVKRKKFGL